MIKNDQESMHKIFHLSAKLIANEWDIKAVGSMHQSVMTK